MKMILLRDVASLGKQGDIVTVSDGHARNFLLPKRLAEAATAEAVARVQSKRESARREVQRQTDKTLHLSERVHGFKLTLAEKATEEGVLYAAVNERTIADQLQQNGFSVTKDMISLSQPIKSTGHYTVSLSFPQGFKAEVNLTIEQAT